MLAGYDSYMPTHTCQNCPFTMQEETFEQENPYMMQGQYPMNQYMERPDMDDDLDIGKEGEEEDSMYRGPQFFGPRPQFFGPRPQFFRPRPQFFGPRPQFFAPRPQFFGPRPFQRPFFPAPFFGSPFISGFLLGALI